MDTRTLVVIESPGKKSKLESILGASFTIRASYGHVRDLPEKELGVEIGTFRPSYVVGDDRAKRTIKALKEAAEQADRVLLATDPDREGEAIAWHVAEALKLKNPQRITYGEITAKAVKAAVAAPRSIDMDLVHAQEARRILDRLVGYQVSPALSDKAGKSLSAGRVQSPAVRLVVDRERAIRGFTPTTHYGVSLSFSEPAPWRATWEPVLAEGQEYQLDAALAEAVAKVTQVRVLAFDEGTSTAAPPAPFTTSTLQQAAQAKLKLKPKKTMELAQRLYEQGAITYMRTDSPNLSDEAYEAITAYAGNNGLPLAAKRRTWKAKGNAQEAHEAIRPSHIEDHEVGENDDERALYKLIWTRTVASQLADATFATRTAQLESTLPIEGVAASFRARGRTLIDKGWKRLYEDPDDEGGDDEDETDNAVPVLEVGVVLDVETGSVLTKTTKAPKRYTLATLVKELEAHGIGRPATYAAILDNITRREYVLEDKKGFLAATPVAEKIIDELVGTFGFIGLDYTRELEQKLDEIADGSRTYLDVVATAHAQLIGEIAALGPGQVHSCPECGKPLRKRQGKEGSFWGCSAYPECKVTMPDSEGVPGQRKVVSLSDHKCPKCKKPLRRNTRSAADDPKGRGWDFFGCSGYPKCKQVFPVSEDGSPKLEK